MKILVAIDKEDFAPAFLDYCLAILPKDHPCQVTVLCVVKPLLVASYLSILPSPYLETMTEDRMQKAKALTDSFCQQLRAKAANVSIVPLVIKGLPVPVILDCAAANNVDLIVLGTHRKKLDDQILSGNVAREVAAGSTASLVILPVPNSSASRPA